VQTQNYETLIFKLRIFLLSREDIVVEQLGRIAFSDCRDYLPESKLQDDTTRLIHLVVLSIFMQLKNPKEIENYYKVDPKEGCLAICPLYALILDQELKQTFKIPWSQLIIFRGLKNHVHLMTQE
jgi:hypothetical protein